MSGATLKGATASTVTAVTVANESLPARDPAGAVIGYVHDPPQSVPRAMCNDVGLLREDGPRMVFAAVARVSWAKRNGWFEGL